MNKFIPDPIFRPLFFSGSLYFIINAVQVLPIHKLDMNGFDVQLYS